MITIVVADDHPLVRQGLRAVLDATDDITLVGEATNGEGALRLCAEHLPDVVLMDLQMPDLTGLDATAELTHSCSATKVLVLTMFDDDDTVFAAIQAGAVGYLLKGADGSDIVAAVRAAAAGQVVFGATLAQRLRGWFGRGPSKAEQEFPELSDREREILDGVAAGLSNPEIGARLYLSPKTVANNVSAILDKLHIANRAAAIVRARDAGMG